ncbi:MAG: hypothetical protein Ta2D_11000 [Rickettsiales bacterium]|nr:MAG: hypothetical protein Ta2D_11000 [Rickettsiales bacterium]
MSNTLAGIIAALIGLIGYCISLWMRAKTELDKIKIQSEADLKKIEIQSREDLKKMDRKDVGDRREFLVLTIKDETQSAGVRRSAAREYLELGYNSVVKQFIYENALDK